MKRKTDRAAQSWWKIIRGLPCYFSSEISHPGADVIPMHNRAGGTGMKSEYYTVLPCLQTLHDLQHGILGFYGMVGQSFSGHERERIMRRLCADAGTLLKIKHMLGIKEEDLLADRANSEAVLRLQCLLKKEKK